MAFLKDLYAEYAEYILGEWGYNNMKKLVFSEIKLYVITILFVYNCSIISD